MTSEKTSCMAFVILMLEHDEDVCSCVFRVDQEDLEVGLETLRRLDL